MAGLVKLQRGITAADERPVWAGHVLKSDHGSRICTSGSLRTAAAQAV
jgi:hypothetical protein